MQVNDESASWGAAGDSILMTLTGLDILNLRFVNLIAKTPKERGTYAHAMQFSSGCVLCSPQHPVPVTTSFTAQIVVFDLKIPITSGYPVILHSKNLDEPASIVKLICTLDKSTGEVIKKNPR